MACAWLRLAMLVPLAAATEPASAGAETLLQTWNAADEQGSSHSKDTPVARVVNLLKEMSKTLASEMKEDEELYDKLNCWCKSNNQEKDSAITAATANVAELQSTIEQLVAKKAELQATIKEVEDELAADRKALAEAVALRKKELAAFHEEEKDSISNIELLRGAITVLSKHHSAFPQTDAGSVSLISVKAHDFPWLSEDSATNSLDAIIRHSGFGGEGAAMMSSSRSAQKFLQQGGGDVSQEWTSTDTALVKRALKSAQAFLQARHADSYSPGYAPQSGEIMGVLKQMKDDIEKDLSEAQEQEADRASAFAEVKGAKTSMIQGNEKLLETREDELADASTGLADARLDRAKEENSLTADKRFLKSLVENCEEADKNWEARKSARLEEMNAVSEAIKVLQHDKSRDAFSSTYSFMQLRVEKSQHGSQRRTASAVLRKAAKKMHDPQLSMLASSVEIDAFSKVKKAIDDMVGMLKKQQADEVKKADWCKAEFHDNELVTARTEDEKTNLENKVSVLESNLKSLEDGIAEAKNQIAQSQLELQRASQGRKAESMDFQKTVADQTTTIAVLRQALDKLSGYYGLVQVQVGGKAQWKQVPPIAQKEYQPNKGATGVMSMIQKLITEARVLRDDSTKSEQNAQAAYEELVGETNDSVKALQKEVVAKTRQHVQTNKDKMLAESDLSDTAKELEGLAKYEADLHGECDYVQKNFDVRQQARAEEIEALQQATSILSGASLGR